MEIGLDFIRKAKLNQLEYIVLYLINEAEIWELHGLMQGNTLRKHSSEETIFLFEVFLTNKTSIRVLYQIQTVDGTTKKSKPASCGSVSLPESVLCIYWWVY